MSNSVARRRHWILDDLAPVNSSSSLVLFLHLLDRAAARSHVLTCSFDNVHFLSYYRLHILTSKISGLGASPFLADRVGRVVARRITMRRTYHHTPKRLHLKMSWTIHMKRRNRLILFKFIHNLRALC
ncbi:hypothetical protein F4808DRAFT_365304 [Astrocystis sublimbata]|nr:hypothetical protein F4808DRAFT_365304 [Astrocystis sublimbata]